jgi:hypothetical protein
MNNVGRAIRPPIVVGDSPPYEFYAEFPNFYDPINIQRSPLDVGCWTFKKRLWL